MAVAPSIEVLARTIWGEARGEGYIGMVAVAFVILNRSKRPRWWGRDIISCCKRPYQFSCWNAGDPNRASMLAVTSANKQYEQALQIAQDVMVGKLVDPTDGADSYCNPALAQPAWALPQLLTATIGRHNFYKVEA